MFWYFLASDYISNSAIDRNRQQRQLFRSAVCWKGKASEGAEAAKHPGPAVVLFICTTAWKVRPGAARPSTEHSNIDHRGERIVTTVLPIFKSQQEHQHYSPALPASQSLPVPQISLLEESEIKSIEKHPAGYFSYSEAFHLKCAMLFFSMMQWHPEIWCIT